MPKTFPKEFKQWATDLVLVDGGQTKVVASQVGISQSCLDG
mgnify:FL=1